MTHTFVASLLIVLSAAQDFVYPRVEAVLLPNEICSFEVAGKERVAFHFGDTRPCIYPLLGPAGRPVTSMLHPEDPYGHRHHRSVWINHKDVGGYSSWEADAALRVDYDKTLAFRSGADAAAWSVRYAWRTPENETLLYEERTITLHALPKGESYLDITLRFSAVEKALTLGKTPFGFLGLRVPPSMSVRAGGGRVLNAAGQHNEAGCHWKKARWIDYSGPVSANEENGLALFDHPENPRFPSTFHVRDEGWIGASFCYEAAYELHPDPPLELAYRLYAHGASVSADQLEAHWRAFAAAPKPAPLQEK